MRFKHLVNMQDMPKANKKQSCGKRIRRFVQLLVKPNSTAVRFAGSSRGNACIFWSKCSTAH
jgi:hypothetical protein